MQPLPLPATVSLDTLSLQELQHTALQANQITKNLKSENPRPVRIRTLSVEMERRLFCIPAANLAVTHGLGIVDCWDLLTSQRAAHMEIRMFLYIVTLPCLEEEGKAIFGAAIGYVPPEETSGADIPSFLPAGAHLNTWWPFASTTAIVPTFRSPISSHRPSERNIQITSVSLSPLRW